MASYSSRATRRCPGSVAKKSYLPVCSYRCVPREHPEGPVSDLRCALGTLTSASVRTNSGAIMADVPHVSRGAGAEEQTLALHLFASPRERVFTYMRRAYQAHYSMDTTLSQRAAV
jgi:hypothetical protein